MKRPPRWLRGEPWQVALPLALALVAACSDDAVVPSSPPATAPPHRVVDEHPIVVGDGGAPPPSAEYTFALPEGFPKPNVPPTNPLTQEKVTLGRHLFYDVRLSGNQTQSCASCHEQARAFTDGKTTSTGSTGQTHPRNAMTLANVAYATTMTWANPVLTTLEMQAPVPMFGIDPIVELGIRGKEDEVLERFRDEPRYPPMFAAAFPNDTDPLTMENVQRALASFERTIISGNSPFDRYIYRGETDALTAEQKRGYELFRSEQMECFHCHGTFDFTDAVTHQGIPVDSYNFHNTGLYNVGGAGTFPAPNRGLIDFTAVPSDMGRFKAPTLRNVEVTGPYMHDGSIATLEEVVEHYAAGGRTIASGPNAGVGSANPYKSGLLIGFTVPPADKAALIAFLRSLTDQDFLHAPELSDPWH